MEGRTNNVALYLGQKGIYLFTLNGNIPTHMFKGVVYHKIKIQL